MPVDRWTKARADYRRKRTSPRKYMALNRMENTRRKKKPPSGIVLKKRNQKIKPRRA